jgi:RNA polymerase sigma-70 factor (ECF subfamily)
MSDDVRARLEAAYPGLRRFAAVVGPADAEPDDLVQEAFVRVLRRGVAHVDDLDAYLRRAVLNLVLNDRRRHARRRVAMARVQVQESAPAQSFADAADLLRLAPEVRAVLWLAEVEGWAYAEIGRLVGCTEEAARARASRGRRQLRHELAGEV